MYITKDGKVLSVTKGAFKEIFQRLGWREAKIADLRAENRLTGDLIMTPTSTAPEHTEDTENDNENRRDDIPFGNLVNNDDMDDEDEDEDDKPLSEMTVPELRAYADEHEIDLGDATKKDHIRKIIIEALEEMEE